jgi:phospholipase A1
MKTIFTLAVVATLSLSQLALANDDSAAPNSAATLADLGMYPYEPIYFIVGNDGGRNAKFELSFKYLIFSKGGAFNKNLAVPANFYLSFSQTSLWDLHERSAPFKDSSYRPRLFYLRESQSTKPTGWRFDFEGGYAHESNGKGDPDSRSIHLAYFKPTIGYYTNSTRGFYVAPMMYGYIDKGENPNIDNYRGNVDLVLGYGSGNVNLKAEDWNIWTTLRKGTKKNYGSVELNVAMPFRYLWHDLDGWLLAQYFNGYGEGILDYDKKLQSQLRFGFALFVQ